MSSFYKTKGALGWKATFSAKRIEYLKNFLSFLRNLMKLRRYVQYTVSLIVKNRDFEESEISPEI